MFSAPRRPDPERIRWLEFEIRRLGDAQQMMLDANDAVVKKDVARLATMGFEADHIDELVRRSEDGKAAFPAYALQNNSDAIDHLQKLLTRERVGAPASPL